MKSDLKGKWENIKDNVKTTLNKVADNEKVVKAKEDLTKSTKEKASNIKKDISGKA